MTPLPIMQHLHARRRFLVAFSGGLDSTVLLHQLVQWRIQQPDVSLRAIHVHHGLSPNADAWVAHCQQVCSRWDVPLSIVRVTLAEEGLGLEAQARKARYQAFADTLLPGEVLVTAQHQDDQCETLLLALKRGSGPAGLAAMPAELPFHGTLLLRPLLNETREALEQWACAHRLSWIEDESNQDASYDRNFIRLEVLPLLKQRWPHFANAAARSAALCGEQEQLLDELLAEELASLVSTEGALTLAPLMTMSANRRAALLRRWLSGLGAPMPSRDLLSRIWQEAILAREDASPRLVLGSHEIRRFQGQLWWVKSTAGQRQTVIPWPGPLEPLTLPAGLGELTLVPGGDIRPPRADEPVSVRFHASGMLYVAGRQGGRKLKKIWQELGVAPWLRDTTPILFYGETPIAAAGQFVTQAGLADSAEGLRLTWRK